MFEPHDPSWLVLGFFGCLALFAFVSLRRKPGVPAPARRTIFLIWLAALLHLVGVFAIRAYDKWKLKEEMRQLTPAGVTTVVLCRGNLTNRITSPAQISELLALTQSARRVSAHHSHPVDLFDVVLEFKGQMYCYRVGRDSERADEYWIQRIGRAGGEFEVGRVHSSRLGRLLEGLLSAKP